MTRIQSCPTSTQWNQFLLGSLTDAEAGVLESHLDECPDCLEHVQSLSSSDTFVESARQQLTVDLPAPELLDRLREKLTPEHDTVSQPTQTMEYLAPESHCEATTTTVIYPPTHGTPFDPTMTHLGGYRLVRLLGKGGMGFVYEAEDPKLQRSVALKVMQPKKWQNHPNLMERFLREAQATAALKHDHIVTVYQVGEDHGIPFLAIELLQGESLEDQLKREPIQPLSEVLRLGREIALGLAAAHQKGLIHRDIKPGNIWLEAPTARAKILDFGLARTTMTTERYPAGVNSLTDRPDVTQVGMIIGTPAYMAPEQARSMTLTDRCDLFSLGCLMYQASTGQLPFKGIDTLSTLHAVTNEPPPPPRTVKPSLPVEFEQLLLRLLSKTASERPSANELIQEIEGLQQRFARREFRRRMRVPMIAALLIASLSTVYLAGASVYRLATNSGELIIETDDPNIEVTIRGKGEQVTILDLVTSKKIELKAGEYQLQLGKEAQDLALSTDQFQLTRGGKKVVEIRRIVSAEVDLQFRSTIGTVELKRNGKVVESLATAKKLRLAPGEYTVSLAGMPEGLNWQPKSFAVQPSEKRTVTLSIFGIVRNMDSHGATVGALSASASGLVLSASSDRTMSLWDPKTGEERKRFPFTKSPIQTCAISADGKWAISASAKNPNADLGITLWDVEQARVTGTFTGHKNWVTALAVTPDGQHILSASQDGSVIEWDRTNLQKVRTWTAHADGVNCLAIGPNGQFVTGGNDSRVRLWDLAQPKLLAEFVGHSDSVRAVAISPDGTHVVSGGLDRTVRLWQFAKASLVQTFTGHEGWVNAVAWTPQGTRILSAASDKTLRLWDVTTKSDPLRLEGHTAGVQCLLVMPEGSQAISAGHDKSIRVWQLP